MIGLWACLTLLWTCCQDFESSQWSVVDRQGNVCHNMTHIIQNPWNHHYSASERQVKDVTWPKTHKRKDSWLMCRATHLVLLRIWMIFKNNPFTGSCWLISWFSLTGLPQRTDRMTDIAVVNITPVSLLSFWANALPNGLRGGQGGSLVILGLRCFLHVTGEPRGWSG